MEALILAVVAFVFLSYVVLRLAPALDAILGAPTIKEDLSTTTVIRDIGLDGTRSNVIPTKPVSADADGGPDR